MLASGSATSDLTNAQCSPNTIHWTYDTYMVAKSTGQALVRAGYDSWYFLVADFAFGYALERDASAVVVKEGGKVVLDFSPGAAFTSCRPGGLPP